MQIEDSDQQNNIEEAGDSIQEEEEVDGDGDETLNEETVIDSQVGGDEAEEDEGSDQDQMGHIESQPSTSSGLRRSTRAAAIPRKVIYAVDDESSSDEERIEVCLRSNFISSKVILFFIFC